MNASFLAYRHGELEIEGISLRELAETHDTPFFLVSERRLLRNYDAIREGLSSAGSEVAIRYCAKTNNEAGILRALASRGSHLLAATVEEVELAIACGFSPARLAFQRPVPTELELARVLDLGVRHVHVHHPRDIDVLEAAAATRACEVAVSLRLRASRFGGRWSPLLLLARRLGLRLSDLFPLSARLRDSRWLRLSALNFYIGTQRATTRSYRLMLSQLCGIAARLEQGLGVRLDEINLGGGFPSPRTRPAPEGDLGPETSDAESLRTFAADLARLTAAAIDGSGMRSRPRLAAEPGRSIVGNAVVLVTRVCATDNRWVFLDTSRNHLSELTSLGRRGIFPARQGGPRRRWVGLSGSTLNTADVLGVAGHLPPLEVFDVLAFVDAGAYSIARASRSAGLSPEVCLVGGDGTVRTIRRREGFSDLISAMMLDGQSS